MSDQMIQRLEEQLRDAHAANAELRDRVNEAEKLDQRARAQLAEATVLHQQMERTNAKLKAAEDNAAAAQRKAKESEGESLRLRSENERLTQQLGRAQAEASRLAELDTLIESAKHSGDLFSA